jgi:hypothetical protein
MKQLSHTRHRRQPAAGRQPPHSPPTTRPSGTWKQVDDATHKPTSIIQITDDNGKLQAKVLQVMNRLPRTSPATVSKPKCTQCNGDLKNQPIIGMTIMWGVAKTATCGTGARSSTRRRARSTR